MKPISQFIAALTILQVFSFASAAFADGLIARGHVNGPRTLLALTSEQIHALDKGKSEIVLTESQHRLLAGLPNAKSVKSLYVHPSNSAICTCEQHNVAVRIGRSQIEVADMLFGDIFMKKYDSAYWIKRRKDQEAAEKQDVERKNPSQAALLNAEGLRQKDRFSPVTIKIFQKALEKDSEYKWARRNLSNIYQCLGSDAMYGKGNFAKAVTYFELALKTADPMDGFVIQSIEHDLQIAKTHI